MNGSKKQRQKLIEKINQKPYTDYTVLFDKFRVEDIASTIKVGPQFFIYILCSSKYIQQYLRDNPSPLIPVEYYSEIMKITFRDNSELHNKGDNLLDIIGTTSFKNPRNKLI